MAACATRVLYFDEPFQYKATASLTGFAPSADEKTLVLTFDQTNMYPEGGGQPADRGVIRIGAHQLEVVDVQQKKGEPIGHVCALFDGWQASLAAALAARAPCELELDSARRWDHAQQHTSQHVITAVAADVFGAETVGWGLGAELTYIDLASPTVDPSMLTELEARVNAELRRRRAVVSHLVDRARLDAMMADPQFRSRGIADGIGDEGIRLVEITGLDLNTCGGTHVANLADIQLVKLMAPEKAKGGQMRLTFIAGVRVADYVAAAAVRTKAMNVLCGGSDWEGTVTRLTAANKAAARERKALMDELAEHLGRSLAAAAAGQPLVCIHRVDADAAFIKAVLDVLLVALPDTVVLFTAGADAGEGTFVVASAAADKAARVAPLAIAALSGRGGGKGGRIQGKAAAMENRGAAADALRAALAAS